MRVGATVGRLIEAAPLMEATRHLGTHRIPPAPPKKPRKKQNEYTHTHTAQWT